MQGLTKIAQNIANGLTGRKNPGIILYWEEPPEGGPAGAIYLPAIGGEERKPEHEPGVIRLQWPEDQSDKRQYYAPDVEGADWLEKRRQRFGGA